MSAEKTAADNVRDDLRAISKRLRKAADFEFHLACTRGCQSGGSMYLEARHNGKAEGYRLAADELDFYLSGVDV